LNIIQSIILGLIQGATEFLPVSSSGHLVIFPYFFSWEYVPLYFTVVVHFATLASVVTIFYRDIFEIVKEVIQGIFIRNKRNSYNFKIGILLIVASIPAAIVGVLLDDYVENLFSEPLAASGFLLITALFLWLGEFRGKEIEAKMSGDQDISEGKNILNGKEDTGGGYPVAKVGIKENGTGRIKFNFPIALITGVGQALAILPGISRSGATISFARFFGIRRGEAVRFSFLLSVPIIFGSFIFELWNSSDIIFKSGPDIIHNLVAGFISSYIAGLFAVKFIVYLAGKRNLNIFAIYCICLALAVLIFYVINIFI
jgi:undecaprenyl-diphosphatase